MIWYETKKKEVDKKGLKNRSLKLRLIWFEISNSSMPKIDYN